MSDDGNDAEHERMTVGAFTMKVLNGISIAVVVALVPQALLGELFTALLPVFPAGQNIIEMVALSSSMMPVLIGVLVAMQFGLTPIQTASVGIAAVCGSGVAVADPEGGFHLQGTGLVINTGLTAAVAVLLILAIGDRLRNYTVLLLSTIVVVIAGGIGAWVTFPVVKIFTVWLGELVNGATTLQPVPMGIALAVLFAIMIVSPISTVGVATAIYMSGIASGVANLGCVAAGFGLLVAGWRSNGVATSLLHVLGSPKVQMANILSKPILFLPMVCSAAVLGGVGGALGISGTPISAGFGVSGLVGPLAALNAEGWGWTPGNLVIVAVMFFIAPLILSALFRWVFEDVLKWTRSEQYRLDFT
ncbi:PTS transporter subunit IIC [Corynebacterium sp.]|uniref:PTS transporter subunit IIC n=1 Tax=Corynebacterium sp. TaxID=1720 RepID=UPI0026DD5FD5|nr:PTS sugar transporter subunit IIC [Corynebacterium sp.]MDO4610583.1 PTS sugar transporter subunit IIC [Corynebacterium sp.]